MVGARLPDQRGPVALTDAALVGDDAQPVDEPDDAQPATTGAHTGEDGRTEAHGIAPARWGCSTHWEERFLRGGCT